ncbi:MAG: hypothetical protein AB9882_13440 [Ignavibacteriaceae bacterium]
MKRFIKHIVVFILPILLFGFLAEGILRSIPNDYRYKKEFLDKNSSKIEVIILGSSHAFSGIDPRYITLKTFNASQSSQTLNYDLEILKKFDGRWKNLKYIVIPISYFTLFWKLESDIEAWRIKNYTIYYGMKTSDRFSDYTEILSNKFDVSLSLLYSYLILGKSNISCSELGWSLGYKSEESRDLSETGPATAKIHTRKNGNNYEFNLKILEEIIEWSKKRRVKVILYTSPAYRNYTDHLDAKQLNKTISAAERFVNQFDNCWYFNLLKDNSFIKSDFWDADHLNEIGAAKLSKGIDSILINLSK